MSAVSFEFKMTEDGSLQIPREAVEALGLHAGDDVKIIIESSANSHSKSQAQQLDLRRKARALFEGADRTSRQPGAQMTNPIKAEWAAGVEDKARRLGLKI